MRRLTRRYGYRGAWLILLGFIWCVFGASLLTQPEQQISGVLFQYIPQQIRAAAWLLTGTTAIVVGFRGRRGNDALGHTALYLMPVLRLTGWSASWLMWLFSRAVGAHVGDAHAIYAALVWLPVVAMLSLVAAWPEVDDVTRVCSPDRPKS